MLRPQMPGAFDFEHSVVPDARLGRSGVPQRMLRAVRPERRARLVVKPYILTASIQDHVRARDM